jgi:hypothetical protein
MSAPDYPNVSGDRPTVFGVGELARRTAGEEFAAGLASVGSPTIVDLSAAATLSPAEVDRAAVLMAARLAGAIGFTTNATPVPGQLLEAATVTLVPATPEPIAEHRAVSGDVDAILNAVLATYAANPVASSVFVQTLRLTSQVLVADGILAESFAYSTLLRGAEFASWLTERGPARPGAAPTDPVLIERSGTVLDITLNNPARRNSYSAVLRDALDAALRVALVDDEITLVRLRGNGPGFCSGGDLAEFGLISDSAIAHAIRSTRSIGRLLRQLGDRVEVYLHGPCIGAGIEFPVFAARVLAAPDLTVRLPEVTMGLIPGAGGTASLPNRIGRWRTAYLGLTGHSISAPTALAWGLVDGIAAN